jgi:hypothetical protein
MAVNDVRFVNTLMSIIVTGIAKLSPGKVTDAWMFAITILLLTQADTLALLMLSLSYRIPSISLDIIIYIFIINIIKIINRLVYNRFLRAKCAAAVVPTIPYAVWGL